MTTVWRWPPSACDGDSYPRMARGSRKQQLMGSPGSGADRGSWMLEGTAARTRSVRVSLYCMAFCALFQARP
jgi:hypothetical protein